MQKSDNLLNKYMKALNQMVSICHDSTTAIVARIKNYIAKATANVARKRNHIAKATRVMDLSKFPALSPAMVTVPDS
jgi:hypothetical protein